MKEKLSKRAYMLGFYSLNALVCVYSLYMYAKSGGNCLYSEILFGVTFVIDALMICLSKNH